MKKLYNKPTLLSVEFDSDNISLLSTGQNANITWGQVESNSWENLFGETTE